jgi:hypothetical protein
VVSLFLPNLERSAFACTMCRPTNITTTSIRKSIFLIYASKWCKFMRPKICGRRCVLGGVCRVLFLGGRRWGARARGCQNRVLKRPSPPPPLLPCAQHQLQRPLRQPLVRWRPMCLLPMMLHLTSQWNSGLACTGCIAQAWNS